MLGAAGTKFHAMIVGGGHKRNPGASLRISMHIH